jgi:hypothetical protein
MFLDTSRKRLAKEEAVATSDERNNRFGKYELLEKSHRWS